MSLKEPSSSCFFGYTRYVILVIATLNLALLMGCTISFNPALIIMLNTSSSPLYSRNVTDVDYNSWHLPLSERRFVYSTIEKSSVISAFSAGCLIGIIPVNLAIHKFGIHIVLTVVGAICSLSTALIPISATFGFPVLIITRLVQGLALTVLFPTVGAITSQWATEREHGLFVAVLTGYIQLSSIFSTPISGCVGSRYGWPTIFYLHAGVCAFLTLLWFMLHRDAPTEHPFISSREIDLIRIGKDGIDSKQPVPYKKIFSSLPIWAVWIAVMGHMFAAQFTVTFLPMYLSWVVGFSVSSSGAVSAIPLVVQLFIKFATGIVSDRLSLLSELSKVRLFNSLAFFGSAALFVGISFIPPHDQAVGALLVILPLAVLGFNAGGYSKAAVLVSRQFSPTVMGVVQVVLALTLTVGSFIVPCITPDNTFAEYKYVFYFYAAMLAITNVFFLIFGDAEAAEWTRIEKSSDLIDA
ncbi:hypothetical protein QR680_007984 [Steinernema hermaphroditum]|uniref:Major facilitator superfamily (MFS) profile domain-containing protein n=1 Tax=Steinernema hermaphroditum TaxID=289476 RepID=A0AA39M709_9BILA|nr:hypothetical protein QR680_007984 [Steinernema hermaphroditum]